MARVKIYQIAPEDAFDKYAFVGISEQMEQFGKIIVDPKNYHKVFDAVIDETDLEDMFRRFNVNGHPLFTGHSMSVSDVVVTENGAFFCDNIGFKKIDFDENLVPKNQTSMRIVYKEPGRAAFETEIGHDLESEQRAVDGYIECIDNHDGTTIVCNEEAKLRNMKGNIHLDEGGIVAGPFFICGTTKSSFCSLSDEQVEKYLKKYSEPENISDEETQDNIFLFIKED